MQVQGSFQMTLPSEWVKAQGIGRYSDLTVELQADGSIRVFPTVLDND